MHVKTLVPRLAMISNILYIIFAYMPKLSLLNSILRFAIGLCAIGWVHEQSWDSFPDIGTYEYQSSSKHNFSTLHLCTDSRIYV